jgi:hypothetical protein
MSRHGDIGHDNVGRRSLELPQTFVRVLGGRDTGTEREQPAFEHVAVIGMILNDEDRQAGERMAPRHRTVTIADTLTADHSGRFWVVS